MRVLALALVALLVVSGSGAASVRTTWRAEDAEALGAALLARDDVREAADARAPFILRVEVLGGEDATLLYDGALRRGEGAARYVARASADAALVVLNAEDRERALGCVFGAGALALDSASAAERLAIRAGQTRARDDCAPPAAARQAAPGLFVLDGRAYDRFGGPLGWQDPEAPRWLGRPDAGIARLAPHELPRAAVDLADPWRAAASPDMRALLDEARDCPCEEAPELLPAGDWRAALASDPRAHRGGS